MAIIEFAKAKLVMTKSTMAKTAKEKPTKKNSLTAKIAAEIEELTETQEKVNAILGERPRPTKRQALIAKILTNLESQKKTAEKLETLKKDEVGLRQELADLTDVKHDLTDVKQKAERATTEQLKKAAKAQGEKELLKVIESSGLDLDEIKEKLKI